MSHRPSVLSGARVLCYINGKLFGRVTSFSWSSSTPRKKIRCVDIATPVELAATTTEITWQMGVVRTMGDGGMQGAGIVANLTNVIKEKYFTILLIERLSQLPVFQADLCQTDSEQWSITPKGLMAGTVAGSSITWVNEADRQ